MNKPELFYVIYPNDQLSLHLSRSTGMLAEELKQPWLWERGHETPFPQRHVRLAQMKLLFLAYFLWEYQRDEEASAFLVSLLGPPPYTARTFDHWFDIIEFDSVQSFEETVRALTA